MTRLLFFGGSGLDPLASDSLCPLGLSSCGAGRFLDPDALSDAETSRSAFMVVNDMCCFKNNKWGGGGYGEGAEEGVVVAVQQICVAQWSPHNTCTISGRVLDQGIVDVISKSGLRA